MEDSDSKYRVLAFGDSLTEGYHGNGFRWHPYSLKLEDLFKENKYSVKVFEQGVSGERVLKGMDLRLPRLLKQAEAQGIRFDWVVILGGINDIGWGGSPKSVYEGLLTLYAACHAHGARVLALTCLETSMSRVGKADGRSELNDMVRRTPVDRPYVEVLDLEKALPYPNNPSEEIAALWDDGLHLTAAGYDALATIVFGALRDKLEKE